jgi:hypothetical protein
VTLSYVRDGLAFTWAASGLDVAALDAVQYLDDGPCVRAIDEGDLVAAGRPDPLDEDRWLLFSRAENSVGVESTLSIPLLQGETVIGGVNFYGGTPHTFDGLHGTLARECGGWEAGAVTNADLSLAGVRRAKDAPRVLHDRFMKDKAIGMIMARHQVDAEAAGERLRSAAERAGVDDTELAKILVDSHLI